MSHNLLVYWHVTMYICVLHILHIPETMLFKGTTHLQQELLIAPNASQVGSYSKLDNFLNQLLCQNITRFLSFFSVSTCFFYQASSFIFLSRSSPCTTALWCFSRSCSISVARPLASSEAFAKSASRPGISTEQRSKLVGFHGDFIWWAYELILVQLDRMSFPIYNTEPGFRSLL